MSQNVIIKLTGWGRKKVTNTISTLVSQEIMYEMKQDIDKRKSKYYINPKLFFKGQKIDKEVKDYFDNKQINKV